MLERSKNLSKKGKEKQIINMSRDTPDNIMHLSYRDEPYSTAELLNIITQNPVISRNFLDISWNFAFHVVY